MNRTIIPRGILALSLAVVLLAAMASTASAERTVVPWYCPPPPTPPTTVEQVQECVDRGPVWWDAATGLPVAGSFDFGDRQLGTTSTAQRFALGVWDNDSFNPRISVSGDYAQTNNCPPTLSAGALPQIQGCLITVTFAPTGTGPRHGTLSTGPGGPTAALTGTGVTTPTPPTLPLDSLPGLELWGKTPEPCCSTEATQKLGKAVKVNVSCGDEACTVSATGEVYWWFVDGRGKAAARMAQHEGQKVRHDKLKPAGADVGPGETTQLKLKLKEKTRKAARKALNNRGKNVPEWSPQAEVIVDATDAVGNEARAQGAIRLLKHHPRG